MGEWESEIVIVATGGVPVNGERRKAIFINPSNEMNYERLTNCHLFPHRGRVEKGRSLYDHPTPPSLPLERLNCEQLEDVYAGTLERWNAQMPRVAAEEGPAQCLSQFVLCGHNTRYLGGGVWRGKKCD